MLSVVICKQFEKKHILFDCVGNVLIERRKSRLKKNINWPGSVLPDLVMF